MKKVLSILLIATLSIALMACGETPTTTETVEYTPEALAVLSDLDKNTTAPQNAVTITLADGASTASGAGVTISGDTVTVTHAGTYVFSGTLSNGQIVVKADKLHKVHLVFNGVSVSNNSTAPFYVESADKVVVTLTKDSKNTLSDIMRPPVGQDEDETTGVLNACIYAADDLTFNGFGSLDVETNANGISGKNDIRICGGTYNVFAGNNGIKGKDSVVIAAGTVTVSAGKDGIKSDNIKEAGRGYILICGGTVSVQSSDDGIQAVTKLTINAGNVTVNAIDDAINCDGEISIKEGCLTDINAPAQ